MRDQFDEVLCESFEPIRDNTYSGTWKTVAVGDLDEWGMTLMQAFLGWITEVRTSDIGEGCYMIETGFDRLPWLAVDPIDEVNVWFDEEKSVHPDVASMTIMEHKTGISSQVVIDDNGRSTIIMPNGTVVIDHRREEKD